MRPPRKANASARAGWLPALVAAALVLGLAAGLGAEEGGYYPKVWYPAALFLLGLLAIALFAGRPRPPAGSVRLALGLFAAYAAWSYLSIAWAGDKSYALDGANRTLMYLVALSLPALWPMRPRAALWLVAGFGLVIGAIGLVELLRLDWSDTPADFFFHRRLAQPLGYHNANVAFWFSGFWACAFASSRRELPAALRGAALAAAGILIGLALMGQSRGWFFSVPLVALLFVLLVPGRGRSIATLLALAVAGLVMSAPVLEVHDSFQRGPGLQDLVDEASARILIVAAVLGVAGALVALAERRVTLTAARARALSAGVAILTGLVLAAGFAVWAARENPATRISDAWQEFKTSELPPPGDARFTSSLGSGRYDIWRVAWDVFEREPMRGIGADNFQQDFLRLGRTSEQPRYPHSLELRVLSQTGVIGLLLLGGALAAAAFAALGARRAGPQAAAASSGALVVVLYWLVHGSVDWFWEMPALGVAAFGMLGVALSLAPRAPDRAPLRQPALLAAAVALVGIVVLGAPWLAERETQRALRVWRDDPNLALSRFGRAADLNPLSSRPHLLAGTIALRAGRVDRARAEFEAALERDGREFYATIELGAIASQQGRRREARRLIARAARLAPRDPVAADALRQLQSGRTLRVAAINRRFLENARRLTDPG